MLYLSHADKKLAVKLTKYNFKTHTSKNKLQTLLVSTASSEPHLLRVMKQDVKIFQYLGLLHIASSKLSTMSFYAPLQSDNNSSAKVKNEKFE